MNLLTVADFREDLKESPQNSFILFFVEKEGKLVPLVPEKIEVKHTPSGLIKMTGVVFKEIEEFMEGE